MESNFGRIYAIQKQCGWGLRKPTRKGLLLETITARFDNHNPCTDGRAQCARTAWPPHPQSPDPVPRKALRALQNPSLAICFHSTVQPRLSAHKYHEALRT